MNAEFVNNNVNNSVTMWEQALIDAEEGLKKASKDVVGWRQTIQIIHRKIADGSPWPGIQEQTPATRN